MNPNWSEFEQKLLEHENRLADAERHHRQFGKHLRTELVRPQTKRGTALRELKALSLRVYEFFNSEVNSSPANERRGV